MPDEEILGTAAYPYAEEVLVEVTARDEEGYLVVHSYQFEYADDVVRPKEEVDPDHRAAVREALERKGYGLEGSRPGEA